MATRKRTTKRAPAKTARPAKYVPPSARRVRGGLKCPDCGFVAKHAMGLGRHRSSRHGVASKRSARTGAGARPSGRWVTREQAAERADVHYNTIRQWERAGLIKAQKRPGVRGILLSADDLERFLVERGGYQLTSTSDNSAAIAALQARYDSLIGDLEQLLEAARAARPSTSAPGRPKRGRPKGSVGRPRATRAAPKRAAAKRTTRKAVSKPRAGGNRRRARARR